MIDKNSEDVIVIKNLTKDYGNGLGNGRFCWNKWKWKNNNN